MTRSDRLIEYRRHLAETLSRVENDVKHIKEIVDKNEDWLRGLNGRVKKNENNISFMQGIGTVLSITFGTLFAFFIKR